MESVDSINAFQTLDCQGLLCPLPIFRTSIVLKKLSPGDVLEVICTDPGSLSDFPAFARQSGHELVEVREGEGANTFVLRKRAA